MESALEYGMNGTKNRKQREQYAVFQMACQRLMGGTRGCLWMGAIGAAEDARAALARLREMAAATDMLQ